VRFREGKWDQVKYAGRTIYHLRNEGIIATLKRAAILGWRSCFQNKMLLYSVDLACVADEWPRERSEINIERKTLMRQISDGDMDMLMGPYNRSERRKQIERQMGQGAVLWLAKKNKKIAGYGWSIQAKTVKPYFFPLGDDDYHLFDYYVSPEFRGQRINAFLVNFILGALREQGGKRAFIETFLWNTAERRSLERTSFCKIGVGQKVVCCGRAVVFWTECGKDGR
jgi:ribosomal protein S18 acetylase RimI-like enzyme